MLSQREWQFAKSENFMFTVPVQVAWESLDSSMISRLFVRHPHLGLSDLLDEAAHAQRHSVLLAHFLHSASALLAPGGHKVCLGGPQFLLCQHSTAFGSRTLFTALRKLRT